MSARPAPAIAGRPPGGVDQKASLLRAARSGLLTLRLPYVNHPPMATTDSSTSAPSSSPAPVVSAASFVQLAYPVAIGGVEVTVADASLLSGLRHAPAAERRT